MMRTTAPLLILLLIACAQPPQTPEPPPAPRTADEGRLVLLDDTAQQRAIRAEAVRRDSLSGSWEAPGTVAAVVLNDAARTVLFEDPALATAYVQWQQQRTIAEQVRNVLIPQRRAALQRAEDLLAHGAATAMDVTEARTALAQAEVDLATAQGGAQEQAAQLLSAGLDPEELRQGAAGTAHVVCALPEDRAAPELVVQPCAVRFRALGGGVLTGRIASIGQRIDPASRMARLRIVLRDDAGRLRAGLLATVSGAGAPVPALSVPVSALVAVQGRDHVFIEEAPGRYRRRAVETGARIGERAVILSGLAEGERVVMQGTILLKGLSFGY
jgi:hypothetical protein